MVCSLSIVDPKRNNKADNLRREINSLALEELAKVAMARMIRTRRYIEKF
jgi:hypothetical protein